MGRKKAKDESTPVLGEGRPEQASNGTSAKPSVREVAQEALSTLGANASIGAVEDWLEETRPWFEYKRSTLNSTLGQLRGKMRASESASRPTPPRKKRSAAPASSSSEPTLSDLRAVRELCKRDGRTVAELAALIQHVRGLADEVGGLEKLTTCLNGLSEFAD